MKRDILFIVFEDFADWQTSYALTEIKKSNDYLVKVVALTKDLVTSGSGMRILPDLDFLPDVDLADIDHFNTAMIIIPGTNSGGETRDEIIYPLLLHGLASNIPIAVIGDACSRLTDMGTVSRQLIDLLQTKSLSISIGNVIMASASAPIEFAKTIFEVLNVSKTEMQKSHDQIVEALVV